MQVAVALLTFLLLRLAHAAQKAVPELLEFVRLVRANLMQRRDILALNVSAPPQRTDHRQLSLNWDAV